MITLKSVTCRLVLLGALVQLLASCATGPSITSRVDPAADLNRYATFGFLAEQPGQGASYTRFNDEYLKAAIIREMTARGYRQDAKPELLVNYHVETADKIDVDQTPVSGGYYGYRRGFYAWNPTTVYATEVRKYKEGTLNIDVVDAATRRLLWEGIAIGRITKKVQSDPKATIDDAVSRIYVEYPGRR